jgi:hypothetical protein
MELFNSTCRKKEVEAMYDESVNNSNAINPIVTPNIFIGAE